MSDHELEQSNYDDMSSPSGSEIDDDEEFESDQGESELGENSESEEENEFGSSAESDEEDEAIPFGISIPVDQAFFSFPTSTSDFEVPSSLEPTISTTNPAMPVETLAPLVNPPVPIEITPSLSIPITSIETAPTLPIQATLPTSTPVASIPITTSIPSIPITSTISQETSSVTHPLVYAPEVVSTNFGTRPYLTKFIENLQRSPAYYVGDVNIFYRTDDMIRQRRSSIEFFSQLIDFYTSQLNVVPYVAYMISKIIINKVLLRNKFDTEIEAMLGEIPYP